jgi:endonuclease/exonuclease/phosphatase family metal-dependent hydrolase
MRSAPPLLPDLPMKRRLLLLMPLAFACIPNETMISPAVVDACTGTTPSSMRVASYNIKSASQTSIATVGDTLVEIAPDIVALQEVNYDPHGPSDADQPKTLAARLGYPYVFAAALSRGGSHLYGIVLASKFPMKRVDRIDLVTVGAAEPRVAIDATLCVGSKEVRVIATHADVWKPAPNIQTLATHLDPQVTSPTIVLGDMNVPAPDPSVDPIVSHGMVDLIGKLAPGPTFWSDPKRIDYLFVDHSLEAQAKDAAIGTTKASDHYPIWADFTLTDG